MKKETVDKANELLKRIKELDDFISPLKVNCEGSRNPRLIHLYFNEFKDLDNYYYSQQYINHKSTALVQFPELADNIQEILQDCADTIVRKVEKKISSLQKEFNTLSD